MDRANEHVKLIAGQENLLVPDDRMGLFSSPVIDIIANFSEVALTVVSKVKYYQVKLIIILQVRILIHFLVLTTEELIMTSVNLLTRNLYDTVMVKVVYISN